MAAVGYTPISLYYTTTAAGVPLAANLVSGELAINITDGKLFYKNASNVVTLLASSSGAAGDVVGPASATDNALVRFDATTGKLVQNSVGILSDAGVLTGLTGLTSSGSVTFSGLTSGRVVYATAGGQLIDNSNLTFDGANLSVSTITVGIGAGGFPTNAALGIQALSSQNTGIGYNTAIGAYSLFYCTSGTANTCIGGMSGEGITTGSYNTIIGQFTGIDGLFDITDKDQFIVLSDGYGTVRSVYNATGVPFYVQTAPIAKTSTTTLTAAEVLTRLVTTSGTSTINLTMPTGTNLDAAIGSLPADMAFDFTITNANSSGTCTLVMSTGITNIGTLSTAAGTATTFRIRKTAANTFIVYRT